MQEQRNNLVIFLAILFLSVAARSSLLKEEPVVQFASLVPPIIEETDVKAHSYFVHIIGEKQPFAKRREWKAYAPASLTKLVTAVLAREELSENEWITFSKDAKKVEEKRSQAGEGEKFKRDDAIRFALLESANDAAYALAESIGKKYGGGSPEENLRIFRKIADEKILEIGMKNSKILNPIGLDEEGHLMSAQDLAMLTEYIWYNHPKLWEISRIIETTVTSDIMKEYIIKNTNDLLKEFPAILGGKTGFTDNAKGALMFLYPTKAGKIAIIVLMGSENRFGDGRKIIQWIEDTSIKY